MIDLLPKILTQAAALAEMHALRGYDAVQLAARKGDFASSSAVLSVSSVVGSVI